MSFLYIVATPIGNLDDITFRALQTLGAVDLVVCEDTRHTRKLLTHYKIQKPLESYHQNSGPAKLHRLIDTMQNGKSIAYVTDAGTPGISDPGSRLVAASTKAGIDVVTIPGASAVTSTLAITGFPTDKFSFAGFIPHKKGRHAFLQRIADAKETTVFFESTHRIDKLLEEISEIIGNKRSLIVAREITKKHETVYRGTIEEIKEQMTEKRGEFTIVVSPKV
jgi:16S rRNA (cytidine1402-2'-O)-methyltransferase